MLLVTLSIITIILLNGKKEIQLDNVSLNEIDEYSGIALMLEQSVGEYEKSDSNDWPRKGYKLNQRLSGCVDESGNTIEKALTYEYGTLKVKTRVNASCYLYFDRRKAATEELINTVSSEQLWDSTLEEDGYRYVGTNPDNYICFGTTDQEECINNPDKYMYRIIGIFEDSEGVQHLKLIKKEALNTAYAWNSDYTIDVDWGENDLYKGINGSYFATNEDYSYMQDSAWNNIITTWNYTAVNTKAYENYVTNEIYGIHYGYNIVKTVYLHEMNKENNASKCYYNSSNEGDCSIGVWENVTSKIGLMYVSDYNLSLGSKAIEFDNYNSEHYTLMKTGWLYIGNSDNDSPSLHEWTMSKYGNSGSSYNAFSISVEGYIGRLDFAKVYSVRPVFYLEADTELKEGLGTIKEPYIINNDTATEELLATVSSEQLWESTLEDDGYRYVGTNPDNYICFGTTDQEECKNNTDKYMYRIIGIFEDSNGVQHLKLIKKEALNNTYKWHSDYTTDTDWDESDLFKGINGSYFATNNEYSYMQDSTWNNLITTWNYTATNTKTYENYKSTGTTYGPDYYYQDVRTTYLHEMNRSSKTNCIYSSSIAADCSVGEWKPVSAKIGLMYVSDYQLALGNIVLDYTINNSTHSTLMKKGWMHISNNDSGAPSQYEWLSSRYGAYYSNGYYIAWRVSLYGDVGYSYVHDDFSARPVFYLESDIKLDKGTGTIDDPYTIETSPNLNELCSEYNNMKDCINTEYNNLNEIENISEIEQANMYRYQGSASIVKNNYICFGTTSMDECINNSDKYMYRIIGINPSGNIKVIKNVALNNKHQWHNNHSNDILWPNSDLYKGLNGDYFLNNLNYIPTSWQNKIIDYEWKYGDSPNSNGGSKGYIMYEIENSFSEIVKGKVSLMYIHDYHYSYALDGMIGNWSNMKNSWIYKGVYEWTMTRFGLCDLGFYTAWHLADNGDVYTNGFISEFPVRPVFYLTENIKITSGKGSIIEPYIIS